jgi:sodium/potassium/calcium exchanger 6
LLSAIGKVTGVSEALLGATVLAWGNSVGDFVSNTVVARGGNPNMAIAACFAGPLMNLLVGTSFGLLLHVAKYGPVTGYVMPNELILLGGALMFALFYALFVIPFVHKWRVGKNAAYGMIGFYFSFSIVYALTSTHCIFRKPWLGPPQ